MAPKQEWMVILPDHAGALEKRMEVRPSVHPARFTPASTRLADIACRKHLEALKPNVESGTVVFGGASLDEPLKEGVGMKSNGSVMIVQCDTQEEAMKVVESDIYYKSNVWDASKVRPNLFVQEKAHAL